MLKEQLLQLKMKFSLGLYNENCYPVWWDEPYVRGDKNLVGGVVYWGEFFLLRGE